MLIDHSLGCHPSNRIGHYFIWHNLEQMFFLPSMVEVLSSWLKDMTYQYQLLKSIPDFTGETSISPIKHIQEISNVCNIHGIIEDDVAVRPNP